MLTEEASNPSEDFCRFALQKVGLKNVRKTAIDRYYGPMIKTALEESLLVPAIHRVRAEMAGARQTVGDPAEKAEYWQILNNELNRQKSLIDRLQHIKRNLGGADDADAPQIRKSSTRKAP